MPLRHLASADHLLHQRIGPRDGLPLIYLPGVQGCWTSLHAARQLIPPDIAFVEVAYPLTEDWTLERHAASLERLLDELHIESAHLIGESFGSLVAWQFALARAERVRSHLLIGGFSEPPPRRIAGAARLGLSVVWSPLFDGVVDGYVRWKRFGGDERIAPSGVKPFPGVRGFQGQRAAANRMQLIQTTDFRSRLPGCRVPVRYLGGSSDRVVPVRREIDTLDRLLPDRCSFESRLIPGAPHMLVAARPDETVDRLVDWVRAIEATRRSV